MSVKTHRSPVRHFMFSFEGNPIAVYIVRSEDGMTWKDCLRSVKRFITATVGKSVRWHDTFIWGLDVEEHEQPAAWAKMLTTHNPQRVLVQLHPEGGYEIMPTPLDNRQTPV